MRVVVWLVVLSSVVFGSCGGTAGDATDANRAGRAGQSDGAASGGPGGAGGGFVIDASVHDATAEDAPPGGAKACRQATEVSRACDDDADCLAVTHTTSCCGTMVWVGIRASTMTEFDTLEAACDRSYPACGCASYAPMTDDGSIVPLGDTAAVSVSCQAGTCKTFATACGQPCGAGRACIVDRARCSTL